MKSLCLRKTRQRSREGPRSASAWHKTAKAKVVCTAHTVWVVHTPKHDRKRSRRSQIVGSFSAGRYALACSRTAQSWRARALTLSLRGMGAPATVGQPATAQPSSHACHAHAPLAHDGAQRRFASGTPRDELATYPARRHALSVCRMCFRGGLGTPANGLPMRHRGRGARALSSSASLIVRIAHR